MVGGTTEVAAAAAREWDVLVIGAGPAGGVAALALARRGACVLLVDRGTFPREKVCGCCLSAHGAALLRDGGVRLPVSSAFRGVQVRSGRRSARISTADGVVVARRDLDMAIVQGAARAGASFLPACTARVLSGNGNVAALGNHGVSVRARAIVVADGVGGASLAGLPQFTPRLASGSRFGASAMLDDALEWVEHDAVQMVIGEGGYVGAVRLPDGRTNLAAALDPLFTRRLGGPASAAATILRSAGIDAPELHHSRWQGTPALTRSRLVQSGRVFVIGDAAGYVEPFTGEGMTWAIASALGVVPHVEAALGAGAVPAESWLGAHRRLLARRHRACRVVAALLRSPRLVRAALGAGGVTRAIARLFEPHRIVVPA